MALLKFSLYIIKFHPQIFYTFQRNKYLQKELVIHFLGDLIVLI